MLSVLGKSGSDGISGATSFQVNITAPGQHRAIINTASGTSSIAVRAAAAGMTARISRVSVRELPGNHQFTLTATARPTLARQPAGGRRNLLTHSEEFSRHGVPADAALSATTVPAPNGSITATRLSASGPAARVTYSESVYVDPTLGSTFSIYARAGDTSNFTIQAVSIDVNGWGQFDLAAGTVAYAGGIAAASIEALPDADGWYRCAVHIVSPGDSIATVRIIPADAASNTASPGNSVLIWGAQNERGSTPTNYQCVTEHWDVTEEGVRDCYYLMGDGIDDTIGAAGMSLASDISIIAAMQQAIEPEGVFAPAFGLGGSTGMIIWGRQSNGSVRGTLLSPDDGGGSVALTADPGSWPNGVPCIQGLIKSGATLTLLPAVGDPISDAFEPENYISQQPISTLSPQRTAGFFSGLIINRELTPSELQAVRVAFAWDAGADLEPIDE